DEHARLQELFLPLLADLVEDQVAGTSLTLVVAEFHGRADRGGTNAVRCGPEPSFRQRSQSSAGRSETAGLAPAGSGEVGHDAELRPRGARKDELGDAVAGLDQDAFFGIFRSRVAVPRRNETGPLVISIDQTDRVAQHEAVAMTVDRAG